MKPNLIAVPACVLAAGLIPVCAQINTGSDGHDGAFNPTQNTVIDMADHPDGIYQYTSVNIRTGVTVTFKPNANNTPVVWLVQGSCVINGTLDVSGQLGLQPDGGLGGPGGYAGGAGSAILTGAGPGAAGAGNGSYGGNASYGSRGDTNSQNGTPPGPLYGNSYLLPLLGGSGGGGLGSYGGGAGGGAILIAAPSEIRLNGNIFSYGGGGAFFQGAGTQAGAGSGGAVRLLATAINGSGRIATDGGSGVSGSHGGIGRVRFEAVQVHFGNISGNFTQGFQPIILPGQSQGVSLSIANIGGFSTPANPKGQVNTPDVVLSAQTANPVPVVVQCANIPLNTPITVFAIPTLGPQVQASAVNNAGTLASSTATINLNLPRGGGIIYASAVVGVGGLSAAANGDGKAASYAQTGLTTDGERFAKMEITAALGGAQQIAYVTESGKRFTLPTAER